MCGGVVVESLWDRGAVRSTDGTQGPPERGVSCFRGRHKKRTLPVKGGKWNPKTVFYIGAVVAIRPERFTSLTVTMLAAAATPLVVVPGMMLVMERRGSPALVGIAVVVH